MIVPQWMVAVAFSLTVIASILDAVFARHLSVKLFRFFQSLTLGIAASYYWQAALSNSLPSPDLRFVWLALSTIIIGEIISRQSWGTKL
jgi:hypothetical protein